LTKNTKSEVFGNQRRRWLSAIPLEKIFNALKDLVLKGNVDYFDKAIQFIQPPRILLGRCRSFWCWFTFSNYLLDNQMPYSNYKIILVM
jgi:hypothetical protein